jgi:hypothetical protein
MNIKFLSPMFKKAGYVLLIVSTSLFFLTTSGLLTLFLFSNKLHGHEAFDSFCDIGGLIAFALAITFIIFGKAKNEDLSLSNRLLLPHYFKYAGYIYLLATLIYAAESSYKYHYIKTDKWFTHVIIPSYEDGLSDEQKKTFDSMKEGGIVVHSSSIVITPLTMILPVGLLFLAFAKERVEDELISKYRTQSLQLAILLLFFLILYQKFHVPEIKTLILTSKQGIGYFNIAGDGWGADMLINVILIFSIVRMEYMLRIKPLFIKSASS